MARYQGSVKGRTKAVSRLGTPKSGIEAMARGWQGGAKVTLWEGKDGKDRIIVTIGPHDNVGQFQILAGTIEDLVEEAGQC